MPVATDKRTIHQRLVAILDELPAIGKTQRNQQQGFNFRGHDDVLNALNPLLAQHGVFVVPNVVERVTDKRTTSKGGVMYEVNLHVSYTFYAEDGSSITASSWGEGTDSGDKSTNKAMTMAFKNVLAQVFAVSTAEGADYDTDRTTPEETMTPFDPEIDLMPGAISGSGAAKRIQELLNGIEPSVDWSGTLQDVATKMYGVPSVRDLGDEYGNFLRRLSNAAQWMSQLKPPGEMPPITSEQIQAAFAFAFSGTVVEVVYLDVPAPGTDKAAVPVGEGDA